jgi:hypothetical protein
MLIFTNQKTISAIKRQTYASDKSTFVSVGTGTCYLRPLTEEQATNNRIQYGRGFSLILETTVDIQEGDKVTINSVEYTVKGVNNFDYNGATAYKRALVTLPEKA